MHTVDTVVLGAGHAGLAVSRLLTEAGREHVVLERGQVGERWRSERWDSLHLLTPNWMSRLPGWSYPGQDPEAFLPARRFARYLDRYAAAFGAPVVTGTTVDCLTSARGGGYVLHTDRGTWRARSVVVATGPHGTPVIPSGVEHADVEILPSSRYRNPARLAEGGVLVVGASSSGAQIADELARAGRDVVLAVGRHTRMPRRYRGMDAFWWLDATGRLARTIDEVDPETARREPSLQLTGSDGEVDLAALRRKGVRLAGRVRTIEGTVAAFDSQLAESVADADRRMHAFLDVVDAYVERAGLAREVWPATRPAPVRIPSAPERLDLEAEGITTVVLATGYRPDHSFVRLPLVDAAGRIRQYRGVTEAPGLYVVGQRFQHRRDSGFIHGARYDAHAVVTHLTTGALPPDPRRAVASEEPA